MGVGGFANGLVIGISSDMETVTRLAMINSIVSTKGVGFCDPMLCVVLDKNVIWSGRCSIAQLKLGTKHLFSFKAVVNP